MLQDFNWDLTRVLDTYRAIKAIRERKKRVGFCRSCVENEAKFFCDRMLADKDTWTIDDDREGTNCMDLGLASSRCEESQQRARSQASLVPVVIKSKDDCEAKIGLRHVVVLSPEQTAKASELQQLMRARQRQAKRKGGFS